MRLASSTAPTTRQADADGIYWNLVSHWKTPIVQDGRHDDRLSSDAITDFGERMAYYDTMSYLPDDILAKVDRASMAVSLEVRVPLLDHRVVELMARLPGERFDLSAIVEARDFEHLAQIREAARDDAIEGLMLKRKDSPYIAGRRVGYWYKWKRDPLLIDCVLMYAQRGSGKRSSFYSDYTFGCWDGEPLGTHVAEAKSGRTALEAAGEPDSRHTGDADRDAEILRHLADYLQLLVVLLTKKGDIRVGKIEEFADHGADSAKMQRPAGTAVTL